MIKRLEEKILKAGLTFCDIDIVSADLGEYNALADIKNNDYIHAKIVVTDNVDEKQRKHIGKGMINTLLPYQIQDAYNRKRTTKKFKAAILENDYLKAVFLPELGGRLWSLYNKKEQKELLYVNDVFQPCNLALRNAWFSGGVEWNVGIKGHNPLTCSPMFAKKVYNDKGDEILRMYEFERIREIPYRIDALLKEDTLLVKVTIENTTENDKYMYWWSNIAVPETDNVRVIVPANEVYQCSYNEGSYVLDKSSMPVLNGCDCSKPSNIKRSMDFFYDIKEDEKKWIASLYEDGKGLLHISTNELIGRKLFVWGQGKGGRNWNKWLSDSDIPYIEIQAGLLKTQLEHFVMDKCSEISFVEGYTMASTDPEITLGDNWDAAVNAVKKDVDSHIDYVYENLWNVVKEDELKCVGSGWGALENIIREKEGKEKISKTLDFPESSLNCEQESWLKLIDDGVLYEEDELMPPKSYTTSPYLFDLLVNSKENKKSENWYAYMQLGIMKYAKGDIDGAFLDFEKSVSLKANPWSLRNLAMIYAKEKNDLILAEEYIIKAINLKPDYRGLAVNCAEILVNNENYNKWLKIYNSLNDSLKEDGRLKMMSAICYIRCGLLDNAKEIINENFVMNDIKEGEFAISKVWVEMYKEIMKKEGKDCDNMTDEEVFKLYPLPSKIDFRMHE